LHEVRWGHYTGTPHTGTRAHHKKGKKTMTIKDEKKWGRGRKLEARKSKRETEQTKQKTENTQATKGGRKTKPQREKNKGQGNEGGPGFGGAGGGAMGSHKSKVFSWGGGDHPALGYLYRKIKILL
jgi:hypothetical protein